jgi:hypothetical protein
MYSYIMGIDIASCDDFCNLMLEMLRQRGIVCVSFHRYSPLKEVLCAL